MWRLLKVVVTALVLGAIAYVYRGPLEEKFGGVVANLQAIYLPCQRPIMYSLETFDARFGISKQDFLKAIQEAEAIWEKPIGKELFAYAQDGRLAVNLVYDYRQEATNTLKNLGLAVDESKTSYDALQRKHEEIKYLLEQEQAQYDSAVSEFNKKLGAYNNDVQNWNNKGGAPRAEFALLEAEKTALDAGLVALKNLHNKVNGYVDEVNALAVVLNRMANTLNVDVGKYNAVGASRGEEFTEGDYQSDAGLQRIDIYEFNGHSQLVRVLAHELGHALGLEHVAGATSIMYKLNQGTNENL